MWDLIVSVPDDCLSFYFEKYFWISTISGFRCDPLELLFSVSK